MNDQEIDELLPFVLKRDNVARYEDGKVLIGDRRKYPFEKTFYECQDVEEVASAIEMMVTQGGGPWVAASFGMAMAAREVDGKPEHVALPHIEKAKERLVSTRPTNTALHLILEGLTLVAKQAISEGKSVERAILTAIQEGRDKRYQDHMRCARYGADLIADGDGILTMCFAETSFILALALAVRDGKSIEVFTPETRPYLQGARLTAPSIHELGIPVTVIGDSMPTHIMSQGKIQKYLTAADLITLDGHVVNKIGTFQNAIAAKYFGIPYFAFMWGADPNSPDRASIKIEERDPAEMRTCRGAPTTLSEIQAYYPAFDVTPPHMVSGVITRHGVFSPYDLKSHFV
ncbi:MAG: S-methyl-5-thioribose-1-phosphate isomerase [Anaerolineales bacterium]|nr:S-methyl-5-thioribose-1-phosphate isomerase [Anaerolineales bacterium]